MKFTKTLTAMAVAMSAMSGAAHALDELVVAYFLEWPTPNQFAQANKLYSEKMGIPVKWVSFDAGTAMSAAMASGDVHISYSQGVTPFLVATAAGQDLQVVDVAVSYSDNDNCVVRSELEIGKDNVMELKGKKVAVPLGTAAHSGFLAQIKYFGMAESDFTIVDMAPSDSAAAFAQPNTDLAMACGWGGSLRAMKQHGNPIIEGKEKESVVGKVFDVTSIPTSFGEENPDVVAKFLAITAEMNAKYADGGADMMMADISKEAGMDLEGTKAVIGTFVFPSTEEQLSNEWMGGGVAEYLTNSAASLAEGGKITALPDYSAVVNSSYLEAASKMMMK